MERPKDPLTPYRMRALNGGRDGSITYVVTYPEGKSVNGRRSSNIAFWRHLVDGLRFEPMMRFQLLDDEEKRRYIFSPEWDIGNAYESVYTRKESGAIHEGEDRIRVYGDALLLYRLAECCGLVEDLGTVFGRNVAMKVLSIAIYLILTDKTVSHYGNLAKVRWFPYTEGMSESSITLHTQDITQDEIDRFKKLRMASAGEGCRCSEWTPPP